MIEILSWLWYPERFASKSSLWLFSQVWEYNNGLFTGGRMLMEYCFEPVTANLVTRFFAGSLGLAMILGLFFRRKSAGQQILLWPGVVFMMLAPINNPWYQLMSLPWFVCFVTERKQLWLMVIPSFYYLLHLGCSPVYSMAWTTPLTLFIVIWVAWENARAGRDNDSSFKLWQNPQDQGTN